MSEPMRVEQFSPLYRAKAILAYPTIAGMTGDEFYTSTREEKDAAFARVLAARNLEVTHRLYLAANDARNLETHGSHFHGCPTPMGRPFDCDYCQERARSMGGAP